MAYISLVKKRISKNVGRAEYKEILSSPGDGISVLLPTNIRSILVKLKIVSGDGKVQSTNSSVEEVMADNADWDDEQSGSGSKTLRFVLYGGVTAVRQVNTSGVTTFFVTTQ